MAALGVCWHVPGPEEENFVFQLLSRLLRPELQRIHDHVSGEQPMSRWVTTVLKVAVGDTGDFGIDSVPSKYSVSSTDTVSFLLK